ncbi:hypothetical protein ACWD26_01190 [Streptomyces sp. NPDC002787]
MKYVAVSLTAPTAVALGGLAVAVPRLLSTESTSTVGATATVSRTEVEKQVREHYALPLVQEKPRAVSCTRVEREAAAERRGRRPRELAGRHIASGRSAVRQREPDEARGLAEGGQSLGCPAAPGRGDGSEAVTSGTPKLPRPSL